jgi:hypothetical protein
MARKPWVKFEGAFYHVIVRDNQRQEIFRDPHRLNILRREYMITSYDVDTFCSLSTVFRTVGRCIIRSCHAV